MTRCLIAVAAVALLSSPAFAQSAPESVPHGRPERPFRGLFGATADHPGQRDSLLLSGSWLGAYDDNILASETPASVLDARAQKSGVFSAANGTVGYAHTGNRVTFNVEGTGSGRYYADLKSLSLTDSRVSAALNATFGHTRLALSQNATYQPFFTLALVPPVSDVQIDPSADAPLPPLSRHDALSHTNTVAYASGVSLSHTFGTRTDASAAVDRRVVNFRGPQGVDLTSEDVQVGLRRRMTPFAALRLGYSTTFGAFSSSVGQTRLDTYDIGVDYRRPLSFSRRTVVSAMTGVLRGDGGLEGRTYRMTVDAGLTHEIGRTWSATAAYRRGAGVIDGLSRVVFSDTASFGLGGLVHPRLDARVEAAYSDGTVGLTRTASPLEAVSGLARLRLSLRRELALFGEYSYGRYSLSADEAARTALPRRMERQGVRVGLLLFVPFVH